MRTLGRAGAALAGALTTGLFLIAGPGGSSPANAAPPPCSCPAGYTVNNASPANPFCFSPTQTPHQLFCGGFATHSARTAFLNQLLDAEVSANDEIEELKNRMRYEGLFSDPLGLLAKEVQRLEGRVADIEERENTVREQETPSELRQNNYSPVQKIRDPIGDALALRNTKIVDRPIVTFFGDIGGSSTHSGAVTGTSTAGPVTLSPFSSSTVSASAGVLVDLSGLVNLDKYHKLIVSLGLSGNFSSGSGADPAGGENTFRSNSVSVPVGVGYRFGDNYVVGTMVYDRGRFNVLQTATGVSGGSNEQTVAGDIAVGRMFEIWKASRPDGSTNHLTGWRSATLDVSGHVGTVDGSTGGFIDSTGTFNNGAFAYRRHVGLDGRLTGYFVSGRSVISPFIGLGIDEALRTNAAIALDPTGLGFAYDKTEGKVEGGLRVSGPSGVSVTARGFGEAGSSSHTAGGSIIARIPFATAGLRN